MSVGWAARLLRAVWSLLILTVVTVGIPGLLWRLAGPPLPTHPPTAAQLRR